MKKIYQIDENGFMTYEMLEVEPIGIDGEGNPIYEIPEGYVDKVVPSNEEGQLPFYRPRWTGIEWIEDKSQAEFDEEVLLGSLVPSEDEVLSARLEIKILNTLVEVGLV